MAACRLSLSTPYRHQSTPLHSTPAPQPFGCPKLDRGRDQPAIMNGLRGELVVVCLAIWCSCMPPTVLSRSNLGCWLSVVADVLKEDGGAWGHFVEIQVTEALQDSKKVEWIGAIRFYDGASLWRWYRYIWTNKVVTVSCPFKGYQVHSAPTVMGLHDAWTSNRPSSCSFIRSLQSDDCQVVLSPFQDMYVAIAQPQRGWTAFQDDPQRCTFSVREEMSLWRPAAGALGLALFLHADVMSKSIAFRLCTGSVTFALLSALVLAYFLYRHIPNRRLLVAVGSVIAFFPVALKHMLSVWLPWTLELTYNQVFLVYMLFSGLVGLALTYYYDNPENAKLLTILEVSMRLLGMMLVYSQSASSEIAFTLVVIMVSAYGLRRLSIVELLLQRAKSLKVGSKVKDEPAVADGATGYVTDAEEEEETPVHTSRSPYIEGLAPRSARKKFHSTKIVPSPSSQGKTKTWSEIDDKLQARDGSPHTHSRGPVCEDNRTPSAMARESRPLEESPLVARGLILNMQTGRAIKIGKGTYNKLKSVGYIEDRMAGTITPPPYKMR